MIYIYRSLGGLMKFSLTMTFLVSLLVAGSAALGQTSEIKVAANSETTPLTQTNVTNLTPEQMAPKTFTLALGMEYSQNIAVDERGAGGQYARAARRFRQERSGQVGQGHQVAQSARGVARPGVFHAARLHR